MAKSCGLGLKRVVYGGGVLF